MATASLKDRVAALETEVAELKAMVRRTNGSRKKDWRRAVEKYAGDKGLLAIFAEAQKLREADRKKARQRFNGRSKA